MADIIMPKMGDAMEEGVIVQWLKNVGDSITPDDVILEIETDKSNVEVPAGTTGIVQKINFQAGDTVPVGQVIAVVGADAPAATASTPPPVQPTAPAATPASQENAAPVVAEGAPSTPVTAPGGSNGKSNGVAPAPATPVAAPASAPVAISAPKDFKPYETFVGALPEGLGGSASVIGEPVLVGDSPASGERVKATPLARAMAQSHNLDLAALRGSGPDGAVGKKDIEAALANGSAASQPAPVAATPAAPVAAPTTPAPATSDDVEVQEYNAMRRTIAKRLAESKSTIPHFYVTAEIDMEAMLVLREQVNASAGDQPKATLNDFLVKAVAVALVENPVINSSFADNKRYLKHSVNIGVAVSIDDGLIVPVVKNCESKSLRGISRETRPLIEKARTGKLTPTEYTGGTFTISNLGQYDVENFAAIINPGEGAILAVSAIRQVAAVVDGQVVPRKRMKVTLCADHRVMDGVAGAIFLQSLRRVIENPLQILA